MTPRDYKKVARVGDYIKTNALLNDILNVTLEGKVAFVNQSSFYLYHNDPNIRSSSPLPYSVYPREHGFNYAIRISFNNRVATVEKIPGKGPLSILYYDN